MPWLPLGLKSFPMLTSAVTGTPLEWNHGPMYNVLLTSSYVRISELGIQWSVLCSLPGTSAGRVGWSAALPCVPARDAFCLALASPGVPVFPTDRVEVVAGSPQPSMFGSNIACNAQTANRAFVLVGAGYQVSLCDLVDSRLDFLLDLENAQIYWRHRNEPVWWNALVTLSSLFFFTRVCEHLVLLVRGKRREFSWSTTTALALMLLLHRILRWTQVFSQHLVTGEEQLLDFILEIYSWGHVFAQGVATWLGRKRAHAYSLLDGSERAVPGEQARHHHKLAGHHHHTENPDSSTRDSSTRDSSTHDMSTLGLLVSVQLILTAHLQGSYDNPFLGILVILFGMRSFLKFLNFMLVYTAAERSSKQTRLVLQKLAFLYVDAFTLASMLELGVRSSARTAVEYASTAAGMLLVIVLGGAFLHEVIHGK